MAFGRKISGKINELLRLSPSEGRGVLVLLPLLAIAGVLIYGTGRPRSDPEFLAAADVWLGNGEGSLPVEEWPAGLFFFDPNTVTIEELCTLGFELRTAASIIKYRNGGKVFEVPEDFAMCYGVTLEQYLTLEPYIVIDERYRRRSAVRDNQRQNTAGERPAAKVMARAPFDPNLLDEAGYTGLGFTPAQARTIINYREAIGGFTDADQLARCYAVSDQVMEALRPFILFETAELPEVVIAPEPTGTEYPVTFPVEINAADSATLRAVRGIGEVMVVRIMEYRELLGGFRTKEQLAEIKGMTKANYERIIEQITVDSCKISKIDINFAPHKQLVERLERHPYTTARTAGKLLSVRQLKGGWSNTHELVDDKILTKEQAGKLAPYLLFSTEQTE